MSDKKIVTVKGRKFLVDYSRLCLPVTVKKALVELGDVPISSRADLKKAKAEAKLRLSQIISRKLALELPIIRLVWSNPAYERLDGRKLDATKALKPLKTPDHCLS